MTQKQAQTLAQKLIARAAGLKRLPDLVAALAPVERPGPDGPAV